MDWKTNIQSNRDVNGFIIEEARITHASHSIMLWLSENQSMKSWAQGKARIAFTGCRDGSDQITLAPIYSANQTMNMTNICITIK